MWQKAQAMNLTFKQVITVASLIERQAPAPLQCPTIASLIYNRLNNPSSGTMGYLQIDATLAFLNGGKVPTEADKAIDSPYNTYLYKGLPPAPIANPGLDAIKAALDPEKTGYFYYALGNDNTHSFFKTLDAQQRFLRTQSR